MILLEKIVGLLRNPMRQRQKLRLDPPKENQIGMRQCAMPTAIQSLLCLATNPHCRCLVFQLFQYPIRLKTHQSFRLAMKYPTEHLQMLPHVRLAPLLASFALQAAQPNEQQ